MHVSEAIAQANRVLPGIVTSGNGHDVRWQVAIDVGQFVETAPEQVWEFAALWGRHEDEDLRMAISSCVLEHLLEHHFDDYFPRVERLALADECFADTVSMCARFGECELPANSARLDALLARLYGPSA